MINIQLIKNIKNYFWREIRSGEVNLLIIGLIIAIMASTSVSFFADRIRNGINQQSNEILAGDLKVTSYWPIPEQYNALAKDYSMNIAEFQTMQGSVFEKDKFTLVEIKAVSENYPLRGKLTTLQKSETPLPKIGMVWVDKELFQELDLTLGQSIELGEKVFILENIIDDEPDRGNMLFNSAPRVMINLQDLDETQLVTSGSRILYTQLFSGTVNQVETFKKVLNKSIEDHNAQQNLGNREIRLRAIEGSQPLLKSALTRSERFMNLAALISLALASGGIILATHHYVKKRSQHVAILRALGSSQKNIFYLFLGTFLCISLITSLIGGLLGYLGQLLLVATVSGLINIELPLSSISPVITGILLGIICTIGLIMPKIWDLSHIAPMSIFRGSWQETNKGIIKKYGFAYLCLSVLFIWRMQSFSLGLLAVLLLTIAIAFFWLASYFLLIILRKITLNPPSLFWFELGRKNILYRFYPSVVQLVVISFSIMILLLITLVRHDLLSAWNSSLPKNAPNHFMINIPKEDVGKVKNWMNQHSDHSMKNLQFFPIVRARITHWNGQPFSSDRYQDEQAQRLAKREFNISWTDHLPEANTLVSGSFPPKVIKASSDLNQAEIEISMEDELAKHFHFSLGDKVTFLLNGQPINTVITSLRKVDWESVNANFFILFPVGFFDHLPFTWMTSFYWPVEQKSELNKLIKDNLAISLIDVASLIDKIKSIIDKLSMTATGIFSFTLLASLLIFFTMIKTSQSERMREIALYKTFGVSYATIRRTLLSELFILGLISGILAGVTSYLSSFILIYYLFNLYVLPSIVTILAGIILGVAIVLINGYLGYRKFLTQAPIEILRKQ